MARCLRCIEFDARTTHGRKENDLMTIAKAPCPVAERNAIVGVSPCDLHGTREQCDIMESCCTDSRVSVRLLIVLACLHPVNVGRTQWSSMDQVSVYYSHLQRVRTTPVESSMGEVRNDGNYDSVIVESRNFIDFRKR
ncbi:hypothetical protein V1477_018660 [Vespula maculifrons]|uniref:Uncharacterized protein n=1 Tax=Vespula maculifrons TaxID=7453 RepID=A0ABD2AW09_VESMC